MPRVSVVIPVYNRADKCRPSLDSALAQTYNDFEVIVVDDASTDDLASVLSAEYPSVRVVRLENNAGVAVARNRGVAEARGELIAFLDSDDLWSPDKLALQVEDFDRHPTSVLSFTDIVAGPTGAEQAYSVTQPFQPDRVFEQLLEGGPILPSAVLMRKHDFEEVGEFHPELPPGEDRDLWLRLAARGPFRFLGLPLVRRVVYRDALSHQSATWETIFDRVVMRFLDRPEGEPYRRRTHVLRAFQWTKIGSRHLRLGAWSLAARYLGGATLRDPAALFRKPARPLLVSAITMRVHRSPLRRPVARAGRLLARIFGASVPVARDPIADDAARTFRLPPDAPRRPYDA